MFTQLTYPSKSLEHEHRLFRTVLDYTLYDLTTSSKEVRKEVYDWLDQDGDSFKEVCHLAGLPKENTYNMFLYFLENYFKKYYQEYSSYNINRSAIINTQSPVLE